MSEAELQKLCLDVLAVSRERVIGRTLMMERANQITDPNIRLPIKYILENMK